MSGFKRVPRDGEDWVITLNDYEAQSLANALHRVKTVFNEAREFGIVAEIVTFLPEADV